MESRYWTPEGVSANLPGFQKLQSETINRGLCGGCAACVAACPSKVLTIRRAEPDPELAGKCPPKCDICSRVCPGSRIPLSKMEESVYGRVRREDERLLGIYRSAHCCHAAMPEVAHASMAGGGAISILSYGLEKGLLDCAIVSGWDKDEPWKAAPRIVTTRQELMEDARASYGISQTPLALREAVERGFKKIGIMTLPCYTMALRKAKLNGLKLVDNVKLIVGLFCLGHTYVEGIEFIIQHKLGVKLSDVAKVCWRAGGMPGDFTVWTKQGEEKKLEIMSFFGSVATAYVPFVVERCNVCLDGVNELADISIGTSSPGRADLGPEKRQKGHGYNLTLVRTAIGEEFFNGAVQAGYTYAIPASTPDDPLERWYVGNPSAIRKKWGNVVRTRYRQKYGMPIPAVD